MGRGNSGIRNAQNSPLCNTWPEAHALAQDCSAAVQELPRPCMPHGHMLQYPLHSTSGNKLSSFPTDPRPLLASLFLKVASQSPQSPGLEISKVLLILPAPPSAVPNRSASSALPWKRYSLRSPSDFTPLLPALDPSLGTALSCPRVLDTSPDRMHQPDPLPDGFQGPPDLS